MINSFAFSCLFKTVLYSWKGHYLIGSSESLKVRLYRNKEVPFLLNYSRKISIRLIGVGAEGISLERFEPIESFALPFLLGNLYFRVPSKI